MAVAVITKATGGLPVVDVTATGPALGLPVTESTNGYGIAVTKVSPAVGGLPMTFVLVESAPEGETATWPDATNTGHRTATTDFAGDYVCSADGETISGKKFISGGVRTNGKNNVTIVDCWFVNTPPNSSFGVNNGSTGNTPGTGLTITHCTIDGYFVGIVGLGTFTYNEIKNMENGILLEGATVPTVIQHNWLHTFDGVVDAHFDGIEMNGNHANVNIYHNRIDNQRGQTSCIMMDNLGGAIDNVLIDNNWLIGGTFVIYASEQFGAAQITNITITNNLLTITGLPNTYINNVGSSLTVSGNYSERGYYMYGDVPPVIGTVAFQSAPNAITSGSDNNPSLGLRVAATLAAAIVTEFRVVLYSGGNAVGMKIDAVAFGKQSATQVATAALQPVTFGGSAASFEILPSCYIVSDWMPKGALTFPAASVILIGFATGTPGGGTGIASGCSNATSFFGATANVALANPTYTASAGNCFAIARIETR